ncbi:peptidase G2 autoproteolytic cleavage domain-containing protein [Paenibacillus andongensis]|uniref:peptidase G2 autoproteolytic cleavage domain-containing protein n=1 Tax=Paenibacillus andongensis TaxID=2975482 RepID=UPI0021BB92C4|nr:peptidase G2 autoproteolytic cleavage domain-containing protein [Paenibacillus andongensis]
MPCNQNQTGTCSTAEGFNTTSSGPSSHAEGTNSVASGNASHAEGGNTHADGEASHSEGIGSIASSPAAHAEGYQTKASGNASHAEGGNTIASGSAAHAEGQDTKAIANAAHAEGYQTAATKDSAHAEGALTQATAESAHAEGVSTIASGNGSHAEGYATIANKDAAHAEGTTTTASGVAAHAEGSQTTASGNASHAEGIGTLANGESSHAEGLNTSAGGFAGAHIMGRNGTAQEAYSWFIGNGTSSNAHGLGAKWLASTGNMHVDGAFVPGGADYAELFETIDGKPIEPGYFVSVVRKKIRYSSSDDDYIVGITSATPGIIGDSGEMHWQKKYLTDKWGRVQYREVTLSVHTDDSERGLIPGRTELHPVLNPNWDPQQEYVPRLKRPEWVAVGLLGKLLVRDDGTCEPNSYCRPNHAGIATRASSGYRVLERTDEDQILVLFR